MIFNNKKIKNIDTSPHADYQNFQPVDRRQYMLKMERDAEQSSQSRVIYRH